MILPTPDEGSPERRDPDAWVPAETYFDLMAAELGRARLALAEIEARVFDENMGLLGAYNPAMGGIRLMVRAADLAAARAALVAESAAGDLPEFLEADDILKADRYCAVCHSVDIEVAERRTPATWLGRFGNRIFGARPRLRCRRCDHTWTE